MARSNVYAQLLATNLELLFMNHPPSVELRESLRTDLFSVPNKRASDELICYLYSVIDEKKYSVKQLHHIMTLDKKIENTFYSTVHKFSKEISDEYPEENLPKMVKSFFLAPSGERYVQYLYKLTLIAMKNDMKADGIAVHTAKMPKDEEELSKLETMNDMLDQHLKAQTSTLVHLHAKNKKSERLLKSQIKKKQKLLMELTTDLKLRMQKCSLHMKSLDSGHDEKVIREWSTVLTQRCEKLEKDAEVIQNIKYNISQLNKTITQKRDGTLGKGSSYLTNKEFLSGLLPEGFLNNLLRQAEETLNAQRLEGPADLSPYIPDMQNLADKFQELLDIVSCTSQIFIQLYDETTVKIPQLEDALFSEQLEEKSTEDEDTGYGWSLVNKLCESTPPEMLRNLRVVELKCTPPMTNFATNSQNVSGAVGGNEDDMINTEEPDTPVALDRNLLKPICFERKCEGSTWKQAVLLSTLKKKRQQKENCISDIENGIRSPGSLTDTPFAQQKRTSNPVKSLNSLWAEDSENCTNNCFGKKMLHLEVTSYNESPEKSSLIIDSAVNNPIQTVCHLSGLPDSRLGSENLNHIFPGLIHTRSGTSSSEAVSNHPTVHHRPTGKNSSEEDSTHIAEVFTSGNFNQEFHNLMQAVTNSNGSFMGASSVFENSSPSPTGSSVTGIHMLNQTSLDFIHPPSHTDTSLAHWDDKKDMKRILSVALSPAGISPSEVRSSTPIDSGSSSQSDENGHLKEGENPQQPAVTAHAVSRIPRIRLFRERQKKLFC